MGKQWVRKQMKENELAAVVEKAALWLRYHPQTVLWGGIGTLAAAVIIAVSANRHISVREECWSKLAAAQTYAYSGQIDEAIGQAKSLAEEQPSSAAAGFGILLTGDLLYQQEKFKEAADAYARVLDAQRHEALVPLATAGRGLSQESLGDYRAAADTAQGFLDSFQDHFLAPQVHASLARCLSGLGEAEKAKATYERMEFLYPDTYWAQWAKDRKG
ncbi:MAG: tetratricopeptide repeat protein [Elusimicrobiota bacterium]